MVTDAVGADRRFGSGNSRVGRCGGVRRASVERLEGSRETQVVAARVGDSEHPLSPVGVTGCVTRTQSSSDRPRVQSVDIVDVEDDPPPRARDAGERQVHVTDTGAHRRE